MEIVELDEQLAAPVESVWQAWTSPVELCRWQADTARALGGSRLLLCWPMLGAELEVELRVREPLRSLELRAAHYELEVRLEPGRVHLAHRGTRDDDETSGVRSGWRTSLALLKHYLEQHPGRDRRVLWLSHTARLPSEAAHVFFSDPAALSSWLGRGVIGPAGSAYRVELLGGGELRGRVLAHTEGRDIALSCTNRDNAALVLRTLPHGRHERHVLLMWSRWGQAREGDPDEAVLRAAFERLARTIERPASA
jgi:uncharacterized protein YndB with AHSA1/START domain